MDGWMNGRMDDGRMVGMAMCKWQSPLIRLPNFTPHATTHPVIPPRPPHPACSPYVRLEEYDIVEPEMRDVIMRKLSTKVGGWVHGWVSPGLAM